MESITDHPDYIGFLATIIDNPEADLPRLVLADWLDERSFPERAEFIRVQCGHHTGAMHLRDLLHSSKDWWPDVCRATGNSTDDWGVCHDGSVHYDGGCRKAEFWVRRGFVEVVRAPLAWLIGGECPHGRVTEMVRSIVSPVVWVCPTCHGTGRTPGHLREIVRTQPVTTVVVTDVSPFHESWNEKWFWPWGDVGGGVLPDDLMRSDLLSHGGLGARVANDFPTAESAHAALSDALIRKHKESPT